MEVDTYHEADVISGKVLKAEEEAIVDLKERPQSRW